MKIPMNLTLDLGDELIECEAGTENCTSISISESLKESIIYKLRTECFSMISKDEISAIRNEILKEVLSGIKSFILGQMQDELKNLKIKSGSYTNDPVVSAHDFIVTNLEKEIRSSDTARMIKSIACNYADTIKERYDVVFASTLIDKMLKVGLLKDDRVASLLSEPIKD